MPSAGRPKAALQPNQDGSVTIQYVPTQSGVHELNFSYNDAPVEGESMNWTHSLRSSVVTLARRSASSSLQITNGNRSFRYALPVLYSWSQRSPFRQPHPVHSPPGSSCTHLAHHLITVPVCHPFTLDLKPICSTNLFLYSLSGSVWTAFTDFRLGLGLLCTGNCLFLFLLLYYIF